MFLFFVLFYGHLDAVSYMLTRFDRGYHNHGDVSRMLGGQAFKDVRAHNQPNRKYYGYERLEERLVYHYYSIFTTLHNV